MDPALYEVLAVTAARRGAALFGRYDENTVDGRFARAVRRSP